MAKAGREKLSHTTPPVFQSFLCALCCLCARSTCLRLYDLLRAFCRACTASGTLFLIYICHVVIDGNSSHRTLFLAEMTGDAACRACTHYILALVMAKAGYRIGRPIRDQLDQMLAFHVSAFQETRPAKARVSFPSSMSSPVPNVPSKWASSLRFSRGLKAA